MMTRSTLAALIAASCAAVALPAAADPSPYILNFSPATGAPGTVVTVTGSGFTGLDAAWIGTGHDSAVNVVSDSVVEVTVPADAATGKLALLNASNAAWSPGNFVVTRPVGVLPGIGTVIAGRVTGVAGAQVQLTGNTIEFGKTNASGSYAFSKVANGLYTLAPSAAGYVFTPSSLALTVNGASIGGANFTATATTAATYGITGTVNGLPAGGAIVTLNGANVGSASTDAGGNYGFFGLTSGTYTVSVSLPGYSFTQEKVVTLGTVDSTGNDFTASAAPAGGKVVLKSFQPLQTATIGQSYSASVVDTVSGGTPPYHYEADTLANGFPPLGMIVKADGTLSGTPKGTGTNHFRVCAVDAHGNRTAACAPASIASMPPVVVDPPPVTPPPATGTSWVYYDGKFDWPGDYSFVAVPDYQDTSGEPLSGAYDIKVSITSAWGGWLPYALNWNFNSAPYTKLTFALKPTVANQVWNVYFVKVGDVPVGIYIDPTQYGPKPVVGQWATYTIPLSVLGVQGDPIYKFCIHGESGLSNNTWYVDNVGFEP